MKIYSWNVNGVRAILKKGFYDWFNEADADILCLQETKAHFEVLPPELKYPPDYHANYCIGTKKGYSGVSTWSREKVSDVKRGFDLEERFDNEGRILVTDHGEFTLLNIYFPNGKKDDIRLQYKLDFYEACQQYCEALIKEGKNLVICGDVNTAHNEIDLARPKANVKISGFLPSERAWMDRFTEAGFIDVYRKLYPEEQTYSWWSMRSGARERNVGWRIDYFFVSEGFWDKVLDCKILTDIKGSDHCPLMLELDL